MTPLPKKKHTVHRQGRRRAGIKLAVKTVVTCTQCQGRKLSHHACPHCGSIN